MAKEIKKTLSSSEFEKELNKITAEYDRKTDEALKAIGISPVTLTSQTAMMLRIKKAINFLYGQFQSIYINTWFPITHEIEEAAIAPYNTLEDEMDKMILEVMTNNDSHAFDVEI